MRAPERGRIGLNHRSGFYRTSPLAAGHSAPPSVSLFALRDSRSCASFSRYGCIRGQGAERFQLLVGARLKAHRSRRSLRTKPVSL